MAETPAVPATPTAPAKKGLHCDSCAFCQMCFAAALPVTLALAPQMAARHLPPAMHEAQFRSAALAPGHKPPIS